MIASILNYLLYRAKPYVIINYIVVVILFFLRLYEIIASQAAQNASNDWFIILSAFFYDSIFYGNVFFVLTLLYLFIEHFSPRVALAIHLIVVTLFVLLAVGATQYFVTTNVPLGADVFGYSFSDIQETVKAQGISFFAVIISILLVIVVWSLPKATANFPTPKIFVVIFYSIVLLSLPLQWQFAVSPSRYEKESAYFAVMNKTQFFLEKTSLYVVDKLLKSSSDISAEFPLVRNAEYNDAIGTFFNVGSNKPNIVFIIVEGLGADFVIDGYYAGFTPFFDSLAQKSLYWKNFLSTTGRTFGVLPGIFGSLPFGDKGFMELGNSMPNHLSLIQLLRNNGYTTTYFHGGNASFDKQRLFLERQQISSIIDESSFDERFQKAEADAGGFSWGYSDRDVFQFSLEYLEKNKIAPRLDIYMTLSTHEPFLPPHREEYLKRFREKLAAMNLSAERQEQFKRFDAVFASLLYFDDALRYFIEKYSQREDFANTIFCITGDHRIIPVPHATKIDRFHVPFVIYSPMIKAPHTFLSVSSHFDITPTILSFLKRNYDMKFPAQVHWLGTGIDTAKKFRNIHSLPFMRVKNELADYLSGNYFLSGEQLFTLTPAMDLEPIDNLKKKAELQQQLEKFKTINFYVTTKNKIYPFKTHQTEIQEFENEDVLYAPIAAQNLNSDQLYNLAKQKAYAGEFALARVICKKLLEIDANYHDVRTLLGRIYGWEHNYDAAVETFQTIIRRAPKYPDAYAALAQVEYWLSNADSALSHIEKARILAPYTPEYEVLYSRILWSLNNDRRAIEIVDNVLKKYPTQQEATELKKRITEVSKQ